MTLAVGMASIFSALPGMRQLTAYWYHFVIMFEALFILTLLETGTRVARFIFQESLDQLRGRSPAESGRRPVPWTMNVVMSVVVCFLWGYLLYTGSIDSLWRMMGIANQLLAAIAPGGRHDVPLGPRAEADLRPDHGDPAWRSSWSRSSRPGSRAWQSGGRQRATPG